MKSLKSPVNRFGGKYYLTGWLSGFIPPHRLYCEPFAGAAHLLFGKLPSKVEILNDVDKHLITFFRVIQEPEKRQMLTERLAFMPYSRSLWNELRFRWKAGDIPQDEVVRVSWWFYLNRTCFGGDQRGGGFGCPSVTGRNLAQSFQSAIDGLEDIAGRMRGVTIENLDYADCISRYDSPDTLFYCDPPYYGNEHYYGQDFSHEDHHRLSEVLHEAKSKVMVSHYVNDLYEELYQSWNKYTFQSFKGSHKAASGESKPVTIECLWTNFKPPFKNKSLFDGLE